MPMELETGYYDSPRWSYEILDCSMPLTFDTYSNCAHQCLYCFSFFQRAIGSGAEDYLHHKVKAVNVERIKRLFRLEMPNDEFNWYIRERRVMQWGGLSDAFDWYERKFRKSLELLTFFNSLDDGAGYPLSISTKATWFLDDPAYLEQIQGRKNLHWKISIITADPDLAKRIEPGTPSPAERFAALARLKELGAGGVTLRLRPFILGLTDHTLEEIFRRGAAAGVDSVSTEFLCIEKRAGDDHQDRYKLIGDLCGLDLWTFYRKHSFSGSGLMRLNYDVKRRPMERMQELAAKYGLKLFVSDAHHKEKSDWCACCGNPATGPLANVQRGQFAEALQIAKREGSVRWSDIAPLATGLKEIMWGDAKGFNQGSTYQRSLHRYQSMFDYMRDAWNNISSWQSPARYFGGALVPGDLDADGNVIYYYNRPYVEQGVKVTSVVDLKQRIGLVEKPEPPKVDGIYPVFIPTRGRAGKVSTLRLFEGTGIPVTLLVEPAEYAAYRAAYPDLNLVTLKDNNRGLPYALQSVRDYAREQGHAWYWMIDDDMKRLTRYVIPGTSKRLPVSPAEAFAELQVLVAQHPQVAISGFDFVQFAWRTWSRRKFTLNRCVLAFSLIKADTPINYRSETGVKTDISFNVDHIRAGYDTLLYHEIAFDTPAMATSPGGCEVLYKAKEQDRVSRLLTELYPGVCRIVDKGDRGLDVRIDWGKLR